MKLIFLHLITIRSIFYLWGRSEIQIQNRIFKHIEFVFLAQLLAREGRTSIVKLMQLFWKKKSQKNEVVTCKKFIFVTLFLKDQA